MNSLGLMSEMVRVICKIDFEAIFSFFNHDYCFPDFGGFAAILSMSLSDVEAVKPPKHLLREIREGCERVRQISEIGIDEAAIDRFIVETLPSDLVTDGRKWLESGYKLPLSYPSLHAELNVICHLCFLNSLSGYRRAFHRNTGQGAHKNIVQIVLGCYLSDPAGDSSAPLSADTLINLSPMVLLDILRLDTHTETKHPTLPAAIVGKRRRDDLYEALETLCIAANDTGKRLSAMGCPDLGTFVERCLKDAHVEGKDDEEQAACFATELITALPAFNDSYLFSDGSSVHVHKRALLLLSWLHAAFHKRSIAPPIPSPSVLPAFIDNVIPSLLVHWKILKLDKARDDLFREWASKDAVPIANSTDEVKKAEIIPGPLLTREQAYIIRASALDACRVIKERCQVLVEDNRASASLQGIHEALIDGFIWTQAKTPSLKRVPRMVEIRTFQY